MLQILDQNDSDLLLAPMQTMERQIVSGTTPISVYLVVQGTGRVSATLDWNDGTQPVSYAEQDSPLIIQATRNLGFGTYAIALTAFNTVSPDPETVTAIVPWQITQLSQMAPPARNIYAIGLPRDTGLPNAQTWNFDTAVDLQLLQSNLKMLLLTAKGERLMLPGYGTNLKRIVFELNVAAIESILQQEIAQAVAQWEPRVILQTIGVQRDANNRQVSVQAAFLSKQNGQLFETSLQFAQ